MAIGFIAALSLLGLGIAGGVGTAIDYTNWNKKQRNQALQEVRDVVDANPTLSSMTMEDLINRAKELNYITEEDSLKALNKLKDLDSGKHSYWESLTEFLDFGKSGKNTKELVEIYNKLAKAVPEIDEALNKIADVDVRGVLSQSMPNIVDAPAPNYFDTNFSSGAENLEAGPLKWWGGKELAEHHDLKWDLDTMYDAVKEGTTARLAADEYKSDQLNNASMYNELNDQVSYLQNLRDTKADAITSGATAGARAANEILAFLDKSAANTANQAEVANNRWDAVQQSLLNDARAEVTANNNYLNLGRNIFDNIEYLYANDVDRRGAELENFANLFAADQALRGAYQEANASMAAQQAMANANINQARSGAYDTMNRYAWMWDRFHGRAQESGLQGAYANVKANNDFLNWAMSEGLTSNSGITNYRDWRNTLGK